MRAPHHSKMPCNLATKPENMSFYNEMPGWKVVLDNAKQNFCLQVAVVKLFPTIENHMSITIGCITETIAGFTEDNQWFPLNIGLC
jgi:adenylosuccinate synthase